jgi:TolB protein
MNLNRRQFAAALVSTAASTLVAPAQDASFKVYGKADPSAPIPISISGFTGEVASTLRFDLEVAGCAVVTPEQAQVLIHGTNGARLEGFVSDRAKNYLLSKAYTGASQRQLAHSFADDVIFALTQTRGIARTQVAFKVKAPNNTGEIYVADYDGHGAQAITADRAIIAAPSWGPGSKWLAYTSYKLNNADIFSHNIETGERHIVARYGGSNLGPSVAPGGRLVAMVLSKGGKPDLYVADIRGRGLQQLTHSREGGGVASPCWSPDGQTICYVSSDDGSAQLYRIGSNGGAPQRIRTVGVYNATEPDWSPDGKWINFTTQRGGNFEICLVPAAGGDVQSLATGQDATWAPNSRTLMFCKRGRGGAFSLSLLDVPTKRVKDVPLNLGNCSQPTWAR